MSEMQAVELLLQDEPEPSPPTIDYVPTPTVGRVVIYTDKEGRTAPAVVVEVDLMVPTVVALFVMSVRGGEVADVVPYSDAPLTSPTRYHSWQWPARP